MGMPLTANLPAHVRALLQSSAPRLGFHGYYRLLGLSGTAPYTLDAWNAEPCWRFAWPTVGPTYCFIGFSAFGDQYALDAAALHRGVLLLDAAEMAEEVIAPDLGTFLSGEFERIATAPYDSRVVAAFEQFGSLKWDEGLALVPPLLFAESEDSCQLMRTNMRALMIANGDIHTQWSAMQPGTVVAGLEPYVDAAGRERIRLKRADK